MATTIEMKHSGLFWITFLILANTIQAHRINEPLLSLTTQQKALFARNSANFGVDLFEVLMNGSSPENIVFSPFSIQSSLGLTRVGASGETARELEEGLRLISADVPTIAESFSYVLSEYANSSSLQIANRIYVKQGHAIREDFQRIANSKFLAEAVPIDFTQSQHAADEINDWVASKTNGLIKHMFSEDDLNSDTGLLLLNTIFFKGQWLYKFAEEDTHDEDFFLNESDSVKVPMMNLEASFPYAMLPELDASALQMPYESSDLSMFIILPNKRNGLRFLLDKLTKSSLSEVTENMYRRKVIVKLPKFKTEFSVELKDPLEKLGIRRVFSDRAELDNLLQDVETVKLNKFIHKAFIEVNEKGTVAAAVTGGIGSPMLPMLPTPSVVFEANRPFLYFVQNKNGVIMFAGNTLKLQRFHSNEFIIH